MGYYKNLINGRTYEDKDEQIEFLISKGFPIKKVQGAKVPEVIKQMESSKGKKGKDPEPTEE